MTTTTDTLPADVVLEKQILGLALGGGAETVIALRDVIGPDPDVFLTIEHGQVWAAVLALLDSGRLVELPAIAAELRRQGIMGRIAPGIDKTDADGAAYLQTLAEEYGWQTSSAVYYGRQLCDLSARRKLVVLGNRMASDARAPGADAGALVESAQRGLYDLGQGGSGGCASAFKTVRELITNHPKLRPPVIHGLLREGESMNVIAQTKKGKSWLVGDLALAVATGRPWLGTFQTERGDVLILDNELHKETSAYRFPRIGEARNIPLTEYGDKIIVDNLRGRLLNILHLPRYLASVQPGRFKVIVLDALYRFWPPDTSENDNAAIASVYNVIDSMAGRLGCSFVLIHHSSKGSQGPCGRGRRCWRDCTSGRLPPDSCEPRKRRA